MFNALDDYNFTVFSLLKTKNLYFFFFTKKEQMNNPKSEKALFNFRA